MYSHSRRLGVFEECIKHMERVDSPYRSARVIYALEFPDNHVYVGLTKCWERRLSSHLESGPAFEHSQSTGAQFFHKIVLDGIMGPKEAAESEVKTIELYRSNGWILLNRAKGGSLGGVNVKWTREACLEVFKELKTRKAIKGDPEKRGAWVAAKRNGWYEECSQYLTDRKQTDYLSPEQTLAIWKQHTTKESLKQSSRLAYRSALRHNIVELCSAHFERKMMSAEECFESARKCKFRSEWYKSDQRAYRTAKNLGIFAQCVAHMGKYQQHKIYPDDELFASAQPHTTKQSWRTADPNRWFAAFSRGKEFYEKCTVHMTRTSTKPATAAEPQNLTDSSATQLCQ